MQDDDGGAAAPQPNPLDEPIDFASPGRFTIHNPLPAEPDPVSAAIAGLDPSQNVQRFSGPAETIAFAQALLGRAQRSICLYSHDLEPWLYDNAATRELCTRFLLASPRNRLRILIRDTTLVVRDGHGLLNLSRRLPSLCHIRRMHPDYPSEESAFLLIDQQALLMRPDPRQPSGYVLPDAQARARQCLEAFEQAWQTSLIDPDLRSMLL